MNNPGSDRLCRIEGDSFVFQDGRYSLPLGAVDNPLSIVQHVFALSEKDWVDKQTIEQFILLVCAYYGFPTFSAHEDYVTERGPP